VHGPPNVKFNINKLQFLVLWRRILGSYERHNTSFKFFVFAINQKDKSWHVLQNLWH